MNLYRQAIALFGFVLPVVLATVVIGGALFVKSKATASFDEKVRHFQTYEQKKTGAQQLEAEISRQRDHLDYWREIIPVETATRTNISVNLSEIEKKLPSKEFQKTAQDFPSSRNGFASVSAQNSSQVELGFRATFRSMQRALAELETRMPQLQLQAIRIDPGSQSNSLNFEVSYTAWEQ